MLHYTQFGLLAFFAGLFKIGRIDCIVCGSHPVVVLPLIWLLSVAKRARLVIDERDLYPDTAVALGVIRPGVAVWLVRVLLRFIRSRASALIAATPGIRQRLLAEGVPADRISLLLNGDPFLEIQDDEPRDRDTCHVIYAGTLGQSNDVMTFLRAIRRIPKDIDCKFTVLGGGERRQEYEQWCMDNALDRVEFVGAVPRRDARERLRDADICVHMYPANAHFSSALASKVFDYMGIGRPLVFAGCGDTCEILERAGAGISVPPEDDDAMARALQELIENRSRRVAMGRNARAWFRDNVSLCAAQSVLVASCLRQRAGTVHVDREVWSSGSEKP